MRKISSITEVDVEPNQCKTRKTLILQCFATKLTNVLHEKLNEKLNY